MDRQPVQSSNIASVGYDTERQVLEVEFTNGGVFQYHGVESEHFEQLTGGADSVGRYFHGRIRGRYATTKAPAEELEVAEVDA